MLHDKKFVINKNNVPFYAKKSAEWIKTKVDQAHAKGVVLGMSGGVDCSVVARLCQLANVPVHLIIMTVGDNMEKTGSMARAMELINKFDFEYHIHDIEAAIEDATITDPDLLKGCTPEKIALARANLRPRERTQYTYQYAGLHDLLVIGTTNLDEYILGYVTKWGDVADINPVRNFTKEEMYLFARYLGVPESIIKEKPSAELWAGQTDEDELGVKYTQVDDYILNGTSGSNEIDELINRKIAFSAHKRCETPYFNFKE